MKKTIEKNQQQTQQEVICNYQDNYYGDQVCIPVKQSQKS